MAQYKLIVYVPLTHADAVREAIGKVAGRKRENYSFCSFSVKGIGRFKPEEGANPFIGEIGKLEAVEEERIEVTCDDDILDSVIAAMKKVHPYEVIAYNVYKLEDK